MAANTKTATPFSLSLSHTHTGWDPSRSVGDIDVDGSVIVFGEKHNKITDVYYGNKNYNSCVVHHGDNLTGAGSGDDEKIDLFLDNMGKEVFWLVVTVNIFGGAASFANIDNCFVRLVNEES